MAQRLSSEDIAKLEIYQELVALEQEEMHHIMWSFLPNDVEAEPSDIQIQFFSSNYRFKVARAGNRSGKTLTTMRDLAWKIMRNHPYREGTDWHIPNWEETNYIRTKPKVFWIAVPDYDFGDSVCWGMYLKTFIPRWFYTKDDQSDTIELNKDGNISSVTFRNGDTLHFKTYSQRLEGVMGRKIDHLVTDEMPPTLLRLMEFITRTGDTGGEVILGFTPLNPDLEIKDYVDQTHAAGGLELYSWSIMHNPWYIRHPHLMQELLDIWSRLPPGQRKSRIEGEWYSESPEGTMFEGLILDTVEDFDIPLHWRRCRVTDPANRVTGHAEFAEDPETGTWYCYTAYQIGWKEGSVMSAKDLLSEINKNKPSPDFQYYYSLYDNAELWFWTEGGRDENYSPTILKNVEQAVSGARTAISTGKLIFFHRGAGFVVEQMKKIPNPKTGKARSGQFHATDCVLYFCRQIPEWIPPTNYDKANTDRSMFTKLIKKHMEEVTEKEEQVGNYRGFINKLNSFHKIRRRRS